MSKERVGVPCQAEGKRAFRSCSAAGFSTAEPCHGYDVKGEVLRSEGV